MNRILQGDILSFARHYTGEPFHALICDAPYHLTSITNRFGKEDAAPAQYGSDGAFQRASKGFMGKDWDGGDIAFRPETWRAFWNLLHPGAFGMTFGGSRTAHRMAVAIEDAGYIIHPMMGWVYGSGFPKATNISKQIDKAAGVEIEQSELINENRSMTGIVPTRHTHNARTADAKTWEGHRYGMQALKPALEPIIVFQKPYTEKGRPIDDITRTGAGALNIDGGRIGINSEDKNHREPSIDFHKGEKNIYSPGLSGRPLDNLNSQGRWPANFIIQHSPDCKQIGTSPDGYTINRFTDGAKPFGDAVGEDYEGENVSGESVIWQCAEGCPALELDRQSGHSQSKRSEVTSIPGKIYGGGQGLPSHTAEYGQNDSGGASRFFFNADYTYEKLEQAAPFYYQAKASKNERNAGLNKFWFEGEEISGGGGVNSDKADAYQARKTARHNPHPTIKPISLIKHLATLLLPPEQYAPRRIFVPFAGTGSEIIGSYHAGWECVIGVEKEVEYVEIAKARIDYWEKQGFQLELFAKTHK